MKQKRYTTEQIIRILRQADSGQTIEEICREHNISEGSFIVGRRNMATWIWQMQND